MGSVPYEHPVGTLFLRQPAENRGAQLLQGLYATTKWRMPLGGEPPLVASAHTTLDVRRVDANRAQV
jgi:hypothetical protein